MLSNVALPEIQNKITGKSNKNHQEIPKRSPWNPTKSLQKFKKKLLTNSIFWTNSNKLLKNTKIIVKNLKKEIMEKSIKILRYPKHNCWEIQENLPTNPTSFSSCSFSLSSSLSSSYSSSLSSSSFTSLSSENLTHMLTFRLVCIRERTDQPTPKAFLGVGRDSIAALLSSAAFANKISKTKSCKVLNGKEKVKSFTIYRQDPNKVDLLDVTLVCDDD